MNKSFIKGVIAGIFLTVLFVTAWDVNLYGYTLYRGWVGRIADALHGGETHE
jgi:hypothetical protein